VQFLCLCALHICRLAPLARVAQHTRSRSESRDRKAQLLLDLLPFLDARLATRTSDLTKVMHALFYQGRDVVGDDVPHHLAKLFNFAIVLQRALDGIIDLALKAGVVDARALRGRFWLRPTKTLPEMLAIRIQERVEEFPARFLQNRLGAV
jgi:hypothetical protein